METFKLVVDAHSLDDYCDGPVFAEIDINQAFVDRLTALALVCERNDLQSVSVCARPEKWDMEEELRISGDSLYVSSEWFWYEAYPRHATFAVETWTVPLSDLVQIARAGTRASIPEGGINGDFFEWRDGVLFYSNCAEELADRYLSQDGGGQ